VEVELATINQFLADMLLPFMRISGLFVAMIGLSAKSIPPQVRALLGIMLTLIIMPVVPPSPIENLVDVGTFLIVIQQLLIGIAIGFISMMVLNTFVLAGQVIAMQTGLVCVYWQNATDKRQALGNAIKQHYASLQKQ